jgi:RimJ/RimL family protein N-acetyltransferase
VPGLNSEINYSGIAADAGMLIVRQIRESDAIEFMDLQKTIEEETQFMMLEPGERETALQEERRLIAEVLARANQAIFVAEINGMLVGYLKAFGGKYIKNRHSVYLTAGVLQDFAGRGIGTKLFSELEQWARENEIHRLELIVMKHNEAAIGLYTKMGFQIEGTKRNSLFVDGAYIDEYYMGKLL